MGRKSKAVHILILYCNERKNNYGRNILKILYCYRGVNIRNQKDFDYSDYLKDGAILITRSNFEKNDFDGEKIKYCKLPNKYYSTSQLLKVFDKVPKTFGRNTPLTYI